MTLGTALLRAEHVGIRELREHLSRELKRDQPLIVTEHGTPKKVILSYHDLLELIDILDELRDQDLLESIGKGRKAIRRGAKGIPVSRLFRRMRSA